MTNTAKFFIFAFVAALCCACEQNGIGDASLIEGGWDLRTVDCDKMVYADLSGNSHLKDSAYTHVFEDKEQVSGTAIPAIVTAIIESKARERTSPSRKRAGVLFRGRKNYWLTSVIK